MKPLNHESLVVQQDAQDILPRIAVLDDLLGTAYLNIEGVDFDALVEVVFIRNSINSEIHIDSIQYDSVSVAIGSDLVPLRMPLKPAFRRHFEDAITKLALKAASAIPDYKWNIEDNE